MMKTPIKMAWETPTARADMLDVEEEAAAAACFFFFTGGIDSFFFTNSLFIMRDDYKYK
jgi:hypothetical protein